METDKKHYHFINSKTGYKIAYFTIEAETDPDGIAQMLENRRKELAVEHNIFYDTIYWEEEK